MSHMRTYKHLIQLPTYEERVKYLSIHNGVCHETFGPFRYLNQMFYKSSDWAKAKAYVISRDNGRDLGLSGYEIPEYYIHDPEFYKGRRRSGIYVHHMNPVTLEQLQNQDSDLVNPDFLITVSLATHNLIHFGGTESMPKGPAERSPNDTSPWRML